MSHPKIFRALALSGVLVLAAAACSSDDSDSTSTTDGPTTTEAPAMTDDTTGTEVDSATICDTDALVEAVESGPEAGTLDGMTDDPVGTAASSNPVLTTLTAAVTAADLVSTLDGAEALTVFAPTDCAFAAMDPATLQAAMDDPSGLLTEVLGFHVIPERIEPADLETGDLTTFTGATLPVEVDGDTITLNDGQATVQVPGIQTANATVYLIDAVMIPSS